MNPYRNHNGIFKRTSEPVNDIETAAVGIY